jgi:H+/Cl- antiporter ClcA
MTTVLFYILLAFPVIGIYSLIGTVIGLTAKSLGMRFEWWRQWSTYNITDESMIKDFKSDLIWIAALWPIAIVVGLVVLPFMWTYHLLTK